MRCISLKVLPVCVLRTGRSHFYLLDPEGLPERSGGCKLRKIQRNHFLFKVIKNNILKNMKNNLESILETRGEKGFALPMVIGVIALAVIIAGGGYFYIQNQSKVEEEKKAMMEKEAMEKKAGEIMNKKEGTMMTKYTGAVLAGTSSPLLDFTKADYDSAVASDKLIILYFYVNWCPICKAEFPLMQEAFNEITNDKVVGFRINYKDNQTDSDEQNLAREFGVPYQHTKVFIKGGKQVLKAPDGWDKARYTTEINKAIN